LIDWFTDCIVKVNLHHFISHWKLGTQTPNLASSAWGWVSEDGREFALIAQGDGVAFAEVSIFFPTILKPH
jgi:hypothetical protein